MGTVDIGVLTVVAAILVVMSWSPGTGWQRAAISSMGAAFAWWPQGSSRSWPSPPGTSRSPTTNASSWRPRRSACCPMLTGANANCERLSEELFNASQFQGYVYYDGSNVAHLRRERVPRPVGLRPRWPGEPHGRGRSSRCTSWRTRRSTSTASAVSPSPSVEPCNSTTSSPKLSGRHPRRRGHCNAATTRTIYPNQQATTSSGECAEGGELDIYPDRTEFP